MKWILEEFALSGAVYVCYYNVEGNGPFLIKMMWLSATIWEILTLCLAVRIAANTSVNCSENPQDGQLRTVSQY
jgi:hypothetical protein